MFQLYASKNQLAVRQREPVTSGSVNVYKARFEFSEDWEGMEKIACFRSGSQVISVLLDDTGECTIPWEVMDPDDKGKKLFVGVYGTKGGDMVLPTIEACLGEILPGVTYGQNARPPTINSWGGSGTNHQHPIEAITGLAELLEQIPRPMTAAELQNILNGGNTNE